MRIARHLGPRARALGTSSGRCEVESRISILGTGTVLLLAFVPAAASSSRLPELLESHPCFVAIERRLESWGATDEILKGPSGPLGGDVYRIATKEIGVWVTLHLARSEVTASLFLTDREGSTRLDFGVSCSPAYASLRHAPRAPNTRSRMPTWMPFWTVVSPSSSFCGHRICHCRRMAIKRSKRRPRPWI